MKKVVTLLFCILGTFVFSLTIVNADEAFYTNEKGVSLTEEEYNFISELYWEGYHHNLTPDDYNKFASNNLFGQEITKVTYDEDEHRINPTRGDIHETSAKRLTISKVCGATICSITTILRWKGDPVTKSYDVMGSYIYGNNLSRVSTPITYLDYSGGSINCLDIKYNGNHFGTTVKLQNSSTNMVISQTFEVSGSGIVFASYQHAMSNTTLGNSKLYNFSMGGYGGVFSFYGAAVGVYDGMGGVGIAI